MLVLHGPNAAASTREIVVSAEEVCEPVFVFRESDIASDPVQYEMARRIARTIRTAEPLAEDVVESVEFDGVTTFLDREVETMDAISLRDFSSDRRSSWDKLVQRQTLFAAGLDTTRAVPVDSPEQLLSAAEEIGIPGVLKRRRGVSGDGLRFIRSLEELTNEVHERTAWDNLLYEQFLERGRHPSGLAWLEDYVSVDTVSTANSRTHPALLDKYPLAISERAGSDRNRILLESGEVFPSRLPLDESRRVLEFCNSALDLLEINWRVTHTELRVSEHGIHLIEVNGRTGGDVTQLVRDVAGIDTIRAALQLALHQTPLIEVLDGEKVGACIDVGFSDRAGSVASDVSRKLLAGLEGVTRVVQIARKGDLRAATGYRAACVFIEAKDFARLDVIANAVRRQIVEAFLSDETR